MQGFNKLTGNGYHSNGIQAYNRLTGNAHHANGVQAYNKLTGNAYHSNGTMAFNKFTKRAYDSKGTLLKKDSVDFNYSLGIGIAVSILPVFKITVYERKIA